MASYFDFENPVRRVFLLQDSPPSTPEPYREWTFTGSGLDDVVIEADYNQLESCTVTITIASSGTPDTFDWTQTGGSGGSATGVNCNTSLITLADGIQIKFGATTGHTVTDSWSVTFIPVALIYWDATPTLQSVWSDGTTMPVGGEQPIYTGAKEFNGSVTFDEHIISDDTVATFTPESGAGTSPTDSSSGNDIAGVVDITIGTTPSGSDIITVGFDVAYSVTPKSVQLTPRTNGTATSLPYVSAISTTEFTISANTPPSDGQQFFLTYHVFG